MEGLKRTADVLDRVVVALACVALAAIMLVVGVDVLLRYAFNAPLSWSYVLISEYLTPAAFFFALAPTLAGRHHVAVDILYERFRPRVQLACKALTTLVALPVFAVIAWMAGVRAVGAWAAGEALDGVIAWPTWIPAGIGALGVALLVVRQLLELAADLRGLAASGPVASSPPIGDMSEI